MLINPHVWKKHTIIKMTPSIINLILPVDKEGFPDQRFSTSVERVIKEIGADVAEELAEFKRQTARLQRNASKAGFNFALAILNEADYLHRHHRHDEDNKFGFKSKMLRKQASLILENVGFRPKNAHKLLAAADFVRGLAPGAAKDWIRSLSPSHIYELSRMSEEGLRVASKEVTHSGFTLSAGWSDISVRRLEAIRGQYPKQSARRACDDDESIQDGSLAETKLLPKAEECGPTALQSLDVSGQAAPAVVIGVRSASIVERLEELVWLTKSIDWQAVEGDERLYQLLTKARHELMYAARLAIPGSVPSYA